MLSVIHAAHLASLSVITGHPSGSIRCTLSVLPSALVDHALPGDGFRRRPPEMRSRDDIKTYLLLFLPPNPCSADVVGH